MLALSHKSKQYGLIALKVLVLAATLIYIYLKLTGNDSISFSAFLESVPTDNLNWILLFLFMAAVNWFFEILKWKSLTSIITNLSLSEAIRQCLSALFAGIITPFKVGEYGAKSMYFPKSQRKKILTLNLYSNMMQLFMTLLFGIPGLVYLVLTTDMQFSGINVFLGILILLSITIVVFYFRKRRLVFKGLTFERIITYLKGLPQRVKMSLVVYSMIRYTVFSILFFLLLKFFGVEQNFLVLYPVITAMYLLVSVAPTVLLLDVAVRGGIAVWLFSMFGIHHWPVLCTVLSMWLLNFVLPALWGGYYVITYQPPKQ